MENNKMIFMALIVVIVGLLSMSIVSASWHGLTSFRDGECELFSIACPYGYKNAGEIEHRSDVYISTNTAKSPRHYMVIEEIDDDEIDGLYDRYDIVDTVDEGDFKAYRIDTAHYKKETIAIYYDGGYTYLLELEHQGCDYNDDQFRDDVDLLRTTAYSIYRK